MLLLPRQPTPYLKWGQLWRSCKAKKVFSWILSLHGKVWKISWNRDAAYFWWLLWSVWIVLQNLLASKTRRMERNTFIHPEEEWTFVEEMHFCSLQFCQNPLFCIAAMQNSILNPQPAKWRQEIFIERHPKQNIKFAFLSFEINNLLANSLQSNLHILDKSHRLEAWRRSNHVRKRQRTYSYDEHLRQFPSLYIYMEHNKKQYSVLRLIATHIWTRWYTSAWYIHCTSWWQHGILPFIKSP